VYREEMSDISEHAIHAYIFVYGNNNEKHREYRRIKTQKN
jgi:hypothetical protein